MKFETNTDNWNELMTFRMINRKEVIIRVEQNSLIDLIVYICALEAISQDYTIHNGRQNNKRH